MNSLRVCICFELLKQTSLQFAPLNLNIASAKNNIVIEYDIGVTYTDKFKFENVANKFIPTGIINPTIMNNDCLEKKPEFFTLYDIKYIIPIKIQIYEYIVCTWKYGPFIMSFAIVEYSTTNK